MQCSIWLWENNWIATPKANIQTYILSHWNPKIRAWQCRSTCSLNADRTTPMRSHCTAANCTAPPPCAVCPLQVKHPGSHATRLHRMQSRRDTTRFLKSESDWFCPEAESRRSYLMFGPRVACGALLRWCAAVRSSISISRIHWLTDWLGMWPWTASLRLNTQAHYSQG